MTTDTHPQALSDFPTAISLPVLWGDQDAFGHVNNTLSVRWFESARITYFDHPAVQEALAASKIGWILASVTCNFRRQILYPDTVTVGARVSRIGRSSIVMEHAIFSAAENAIASDGQCVVVAFDYEQQQSIHVPASLRSALGQIEGRDL